MKPRVILIFLAGIALMLAAIYVWRRTNRSTETDAFIHELRFAREEEMPTTWVEFAHLIVPAKPSENAASMYRELRFQPEELSKLSNLVESLSSRPNAADISEAGTEIVSQKASIALIEGAATKAKCWFAGDWSKGRAEPQGEYLKMLFGARLLELRAEVSACEDHPSDALNSIWKTLQIARQFGQGKTYTSSKFEQDVYLAGIRILADWSFVHRDRPEYLHALVTAEGAWPIPNVQAMHRGDWLELRDLLRLSTTAGERAQFGIFDNTVSRSENLPSTLKSRPQADAQILREMRRMWEAYADSPKVRIKEMDEAWHDLLPALGAYPTGSDLYLKQRGLGSKTKWGQPNHADALYDLILKSRRLCFAGVARALTGKVIPKMIDTSDLLSPFDGKPIGYRFDGKRIWTTVSCPDREIPALGVDVPAQKQ